jgi:hypothetical protein
MGAQATGRQLASQAGSRRVTLYSGFFVLCAFGWSLAHEVEPDRSSDVRGRSPLPGCGRLATSLWSEPQRDAAARSEAGAARGAPGQPPEKRGPTSTTRSNEQPHLQLGLEVVLRKMDQRLLGTVRDRTSSIPRGAYFHLVRLAQEVEPAALQKAALANPPLVELMSQPERFRGRPIRLDGYARRITAMDPGPNTAGVTLLYEVAVFSHEGDHNPWIFVVLQVPDQMPRGDDLAEAVTATGFFLKLWAYRAQDGVRVAPLLVGPRIVWRPAVQDPAFGRLGWLVATAIFCLVVLVGVTAWSALPGPYFKRSHGVRETHHLASGASQDPGNPEEFLRHLEEADRLSKPFDA